jgi:hypothetical protein
LPIRKSQSRNLGVSPGSAVAQPHAQTVLPRAPCAGVYFSGRTGALSLILHSVSDNPDDDLPPGKHIVWGDEAKPPVFGHWPTALLYGPRGGDGSAAREFFVLAMHHHSWSLALARSQYRRGSGYACSGLWWSWHRLGCRMGAKILHPAALGLNHRNRGTTGSFSDKST